MKCFNCHKEIEDEREMKMVSQDADFVCNEKCEKEYLRKRQEFFDNIGDDEWYKNYMGGC